MADSRRNSLSSGIGSSGSSTPARRLSASAASDAELFPLELQVGVANLPPNSNPIIGMFSIDNTTGALVFLSHTEVKRNSTSCIFDKLMFCNYYSGRHQKLQLNVYAVNWSNDGVDNAICEEDRIGSVIIQLDKITALQSQINFIPVNLELPLWHDTDMSMNAKLNQLKTTLKIQFRAQDGVDTGPRTGPENYTQMTLQEAIGMMEKGAVFKKYAYSSSAAPSKRFVFYDRTVGELGTLYWCPVGKRKKDKSKCIPLTSITGLYEQNQTPAFKRHQRRLSKTSVDKLFSIVSKKRTLDLECPSTEFRDAFMFGIHKILTSKGFGIQEKLAGEENKNNGLIRNIFVIQSKVRNIPIMPWTVDESNDTIVGLFERQGNQFVYIEQTEWVKGNSMPNFQTPLLLPFLLPLQPNVVRFNVYDHSFDDEHLIGCAVVRLDFFQKYAGQEMLVKLRNPHSQEIDQLLQENNTYMLLTAFIKQDTGRSADSLATKDPNAKIPETKEQYQSILQEFHEQMRKGPGGHSSGKGGIGRKITAAFTRSTLAFMGAGENFTLYPPKESPGTPELCSKLKNSQQPIPVTVYFRPQAPFGTLIFVTDFSGDVDGMDKKGNPLDPFLILPIEKLFDCKQGINENTTNADAKTKAKPNNTFHIEMKEASDSEVDHPAFSFELEARNVGMRDAWQAGIAEFILYVLEAESPLDDEDSDDPLAFIDGTKRKAVHLARRQARIAGKSDVFKDGDEEEGGDGSGSGGGGDGSGEQKGGKGKKKLDADAANDLDAKFESKEEKKKEEELDLKVFDDIKKPSDLPPAIIGADGVPAAPPMFGDVVVGDGVPAPPPMAPGLGPGFGIPAYNGPKLKKLHWEVMDGSVEGTLWALIKSQMDEEGGALLEELFKMADAKALKKPEEEDKNAVKRILDSKRAQNVEILLKNFRMPYDAICEAILGMDMTILTQERLQMLLTICPNADEIKSLKDWIKKGGDPAKLGNAEQFALKLDNVPRCQMRLRLLLFQAKFDGLVEDMIATYSRLLKAGIRVKSSDKLKTVMQVVLSVGNHLNRGTRNGQAQGFRLASLDKLTDTRSTDNKMTLLDFIVEHVNKTANKDAFIEEQKEGEENKETKPIQKGERLPPPSYLLELQESLHDAALIDWAALNVERETLLAGLEDLERELKSMENQEIDESKDKFKAVMSSFLTHASTRVDKLKQKYNEVQTVSVKLIAYFGENTESMELTEFFKIFDRFLNNYKQSEINIFNRKEVERKKKLAAENKALQKRSSVSKPNEENQPVDPNNPFGAKLKKRDSVDQGKPAGETSSSSAESNTSNPFGAVLRKNSVVVEPKTDDANKKSEESQPQFGTHMLKKSSITTPAEKSISEEGSSSVPAIPTVAPVAPAP